MATVGSDRHTFEAIYDWAKLPEGWDAPMAAVAVDSRDRVYGFNRGERGVIVFDTDGNYLSDWEGVEFVFPHAIYADPSDNIWIVDRDAGQVLKYTTDGELLMSHWRAGLPLGYGGGQFGVLVERVERGHARRRAVQPSGWRGGGGGRQRFRG